MMAEPGMPPGQIDNLSLKIGELLEGQRALDRYTHDHAHDVGNLSGKIDGLNHSIRKQFEELESRINRRIEDSASQLRSEIMTLTGQLASANVKIALLESNELRRQGALSVGGWLLKSPFVGWLAALLALAAAMLARDRGL
jgi:chromosome segregation ATPase